MLELGCKVVECDELVESRGFCTLHLRRFIAGNVQETPEGWIDFCAQGHAMMGDNVRWESSGKRGKKRRRCRACLRDKAQRQARERIVEVEIPKPYRPTDLVLTNAIAEFDEALSHVTVPCKGNPGPYMDWEDEDAPTPAEADALCNGKACALVKLCGNRAVAGDERHGVWGGRVIVNGVWQ